MTDSSSITDNLNQLSSTDDITRVACATLKQEFDVSRVLVAVVDENTNEVTGIADSRDSNLGCALGTRRLSDFASEDTLRELRSGRIVAIDDITTDPRIAPSADAFAVLGAQALLISPHTIEGRLDLVIMLQHSRPHTWSGDEIDGLRDLVARIYPRLERVRAEERLRASEERYRTLFSSIDEGFGVAEVFFDDDGRPIDYRMLEVNHHFEPMTGISAKEALSGKGIREVAPDLEEKWYQIYGHVAATGESVRFVESSDALNRWFDVYAFRLGKPELRQVAILFNDITKRTLAEKALRESEARKTYLLALSDRLRPIANPIEIQRAATAVLGEHLGVSRVFYGEIDAETNMLTVTADYFLTGAPTIVGRHDLSNFGSIVVDTLTSGQTLVFNDSESMPELAREERVSYRMISVRSGIAVPLIKEGRLTAVLAVHQTTARSWARNEIDLIEETAERTWAAVERTRAEQQREQARRAAEDAVRVRDMFLSIASHELRNPLTRVRMSAQLLRRSVEHGRLDEERGLDLTGKLIEACDRLAVLVDDLSDVSQIQAGGLRIDKQPVDLAELTRSTVDSHRGLLDRHRVRLEVEEGRTVSLDRERIRQIMNNLLDNAVKYSPEGGEVCVTLAYDDDGALLRVEDSGIGLPSDALETVFEPFSRASNALASDISGMGLGLYICRRVAEAHGGRMWAESDGEGRGASFCLWLPLNDRDDNRA
jgi:PAS domain S-box-containing protein